VSVRLPRESQEAFYYLFTFAGEARRQHNNQQKRTPNPTENQPIETRIIGPVIPIQQRHAGKDYSRKPLECHPSAFVINSAGKCLTPEEFAPRGFLLSISRCEKREGRDLAPEPSGGSIYSGIRALIRFPHRGHLRPDLTSRPLRFNSNAAATNPRQLTLPHRLQLECSAFITPCSGSYGTAPPKRLPSMGRVASTRQTGFVLARRTPTNGQGKRRGYSNPWTGYRERMAGKLGAVVCQNH
jgi:hypothetical protein